MAYDIAKIRKARSMYVYENCTFEDVARALRVPAKTVRNWRERARGRDGDDWDKARHIAGLSEQNVEAINRQVYADWLSRFHEVQKSILAEDKMPAIEKVGALASLADSFNKMIGALRRIEPEVNLAATALRVLEVIAEYLNSADTALSRKFGEHIDAIGVKIQREFGK